MEFKELILADVDKKYKNMLEGKTPSPLSKQVKIADSSTYKTKRKNYLNRLNKEKDSINGAIEKIVLRRNDRLSREKQLRQTKVSDKQKLKLCWFLTIIGLVLSTVLCFVALKNGANIWVEKVLIPECGFDTFFTIFIKDNAGNAGLEVGIITIVLEVIAYVIFLICCIKKSEIGLFFGVLFGGMLLGFASLALPFLAIRLLLTGLSYVIYFLLTPLGLLALALLSIILILVNARKLELRLSKFKVFLQVVVLIVVSLYCANVGSEYSEDNYEYRSRYNGTSIESSMQIKLDERDSIRLLGGTSRYYVFKPTKSGEYIIDFSDSIYVDIVDKEGFRIDTVYVEKESLGSGSAKKFEVQRSNVYYIVVSLSNSKWLSGHGSIKLYKATDNN